MTCHQLQRSDRGGYPEPIGLDHFFCHIMHLSHVIPEDHVVPKNNVFWIIFHALSSYGSSPPLGLGTGFSGGFLTLDSIHRFSRYASFSHDSWALSSHAFDTLIFLLAYTACHVMHLSHMILEDSNDSDPPGGLLGRILGVMHLSHMILEDSHNSDPPGGLLGRILGVMHLSHMILEDSHDSDPPDGLLGRILGVMHLSHVILEEFHDFDPPVGPLGRIFGTLMALFWRILALILLLILLGEFWAHLWHVLGAFWAHCHGKFHCFLVPFINFSKSTLSTWR